jgi:hypothetical protein
MRKVDKLYPNILNVDRDILIDNISRWWKSGNIVNEEIIPTIAENSYHMMEINSTKRSFIEIKKMRSETEIFLVQKLIGDCVATSFQSKK